MKVYYQEAMTTSTAPGKYYIFDSVLNTCEILLIDMAASWFLAVKLKGAKTEYKIWFVI